ncbi:MAG: hypothetical protein IT306_10090 [Chloroflexi bacterium]|nr:hypothetical protein [Chloroflexota bacterium]
MRLHDALRWLAADAPVPVFAVAGAGAREAVQRLRLSEELRLVDTPRAGSVLLVAGGIPESLAEPLARVHDALPHPRCTVWWGPESEGIVARFPDSVLVHDDPVGAIVSAHRDLLAGRRRSDPPILPDADPAPWRGVGPYGQGGSGMTGGIPYGRPMAELGPDRDGLRLDVLPVTVGPFFPRFPVGLALDVTLAGDVVVDATVHPNPFVADGSPPLAARPGLAAFVRALAEPVRVAELELARAREHLRWLADALVAHGLPSLGSRVLRLAARVGPGDGASVRDLARTLGWTQVLRWSTAGVGRVAGEDARGIGGPVARAAGAAEDARAEDPAYRALGFAPVLHRGGDAADRWRQRLAEAAQSLDLAARAGDRRAEPRGRVESPRGLLTPESAATTRLLPLLPPLLAGQEWGDAVATLVSLDLDLEEAALVARQVAGAVVG